MTIELDEKIRRIAEPLGWEVRIRGTHNAHVDTVILTSYNDIDEHSISADIKDENFYAFVDAIISQYKEEESVADLIAVLQDER